MNRTTFFFIRLPVALSLLGHGLVRLPKLRMFSEWMVEAMEKSFLPSTLVTVWSYALPFIELILGVLLLIGYKAKYSIYAGLALMGVLIFGSTSVEDWGAIEAQLIHSVYLFALLWYVEKYSSGIPNDLKQ
ncbi:MauE/DoxX family redox-associated membrane protein [Massilibacteroides sp.]|uniref:MauE/DoxX family redox-associated membrane protein n=1 Tax=Massilibacteroides sp. TaxID=2034766 RepID=UPI0026182A29|nr:MauE/DoxX family redox-associated membrane protein [Massilibacteroides sp.]MDD4515302.1 DoxX family membrane protein [Massilibacteroides sp.]